jgi:nitrous oxidase accessory protein
MWPLLLLAVLAGPSRFDLQRAIRNAHAGDTIRVPAGTYRGPVTIANSVVVMGVPGTRIDGGRQGTTITMSGDSAALIGFTVFNSGRSLDDDDAAVKLVRCTACSVTSVVIHDALHGIYLLESNFAVIIDNVIHGDQRLPEARRGNGIHLFNSSGARVSGNTIRRSRDGIYFVGSNQTSVVGNDVAQVRYGVHYMYSDDNEFIRNRFTRNAAGAAIMVSKRIRFEDNVFSQHVGYRAYGILLQTAEQVTAERNRIEGNLTGLFMDASVGNTFRNNLIAGNGVGIDMLASSENNVFTENTIVSNRTAVRTVLGIGTNEWAQAGRGNYWGSKDVFDLNRDGIGDRPLRVADPFATLAAMRPVLEIFNGTPAATALSWAERALPLFGLPEVIDPAPLAHRPFMRARP